MQNNIYPLFCTLNNNYLVPFIQNYKMNKRTIDPNNTPTRDFHQFLLGSVAPRPIAFVSTIDEDGNHNLAPYSFFNVFSSNPPIAVFSSNRRVLNNTTKDTLANVMTTKEAVINVVNYDIVHQMALASVEFDSDVSEFVKAGLTPVPSAVIKPPRVAEAPASMECTVEDIITLGEHGGAGHLIICKIHLLHVNEDAIDEQNRIDPHAMDLMGRMGRAFYCRASGPNVFPVVQAVTKMVIGFDAIPDLIKKSDQFSGQEISMLAGQHSLPTALELAEAESLYKDLNEPQKLEKIKELIHVKAYRMALSLTMHLAN